METFFDTWIAELRGDPKKTETDRSGTGSVPADPDVLRGGAGGAAADAGRSLMVQPFAILQAADIREQVIS